MTLSLSKGHEEFSSLERNVLAGIMLSHYIMEDTNVFLSHVIQITEKLYLCLLQRRDIMGLIPMAKTSFETFFSKFPSQAYKKNWSIVNPGDNLRTIYYIKRGYVRLYSISREGEELTLIVYKPGEIFPLIVALTPPSPFRYWVETITSSEIVSVPVDSFKGFIEKNPNFLAHVSVETILRLDRILRRMENLVFGTVSQRLCSLVLILSERFGKKVKEGIYIEAPFTHKDLASLAGITRETTSAIMSDLKKRGILDYKNHHILVENIPKLTKESLIT